MVEVTDQELRQYLLDFAMEQWSKNNPEGTYPEFTEEFANFLKLKENLKS